MADVVGRIYNNGAAAFTEAEPWCGPSRIIICSDERGVRHGRVEWLAADIDDEFDAALENLRAVALRRRITLSLVSDRHPQSDPGTA